MATEKNPNAIYMTPRIEADIHELSVTGEIPADLAGTFATVGPEPQFVPRADIQHAFVNGDGMMNAVRLRGGRASYQSRWVRTAKWKLEREAGRNLFGAYRNPWTDAPATRGVSPGTANTTMYWHGGRLMALKEDALPVEIDPSNLATRQVLEYDGRLVGPNMSAHPKTCSRTGEMFNVGTMGEGPGSPIMTFYVFDREGALTTAERFEAPFCCMLHDFLVSDHYVIIPCYPSTCDVERMKAGGPVWAFQRDIPTHVAVIPRSTGVAGIKWFQTRTCYSFHNYNAFDNGSKITLDLCESPVNPFFLPPSEVGPGEAEPKFMRWHLDMETGQIQHEQLWEETTEFPRIDERFMARGYRYAYGISAAPDSGPAMLFGREQKWLVRYDTDKMERVYHDYGPGLVLHEPVFVPRNADAAEGEGYVLQLTTNMPANLTSLNIFDAENIGDGPLAVAAIPYAITIRFHGNWIPAQ